MIRPLRALLVDDERSARNWLRKLLAVHREIQIIGEAEGVHAAIDLANREKPDVIFLDVQMPPGTGFDILPQLRPLPQIIFVTAHDNFAVKAFETHALDYLLKPVHPKRLEQTIQRLRPSTAPRSFAARQLGTSLQVQDLVPLRDRGILRMVPLHAIAAIQAEAAYSRVWLKNDKPMLIFRRVGEWDDLLPQPPFARVDRSLLVNLDLVQRVTVQTRDETQVVMDGLSAPLLLGRTASLRLRRLLSHRRR